ncbi:DNA-binding response regulator [Paenibacillus sp. Soil750]|uniref:DNA-binding response regulator n=1 Tax=Paenibacillus sp. Soil750 TaxID=1736398 RepID=UPI001F296684|nr:DNA-binding response regulator [Paenibacillus sp. Soil750]
MDIYESWLEKQRKNLGGEALRRLNEGHAHNEKLFVHNLWLPAVGNLDFLHAEYEVTNFRDGFFYLDFAYIRPPYLINWEVDDFSSHAKLVTRRSFEYERERQNQLILNGWQIYRFPLDAIKEKPRRCQQLIQQVLGKLYGGGVTTDVKLSLKQREILRFATQIQRPFMPQEICELLAIKGQHAWKLLHELVQFELLLPTSGSSRIRTYRLGDMAIQRHIRL